MGTGGSVKRAVEELRKWSGRADAIGVSGVHDARGGRNPEGQSREPSEGCADASDAERAVVTDGHRLRNVLQEWTIRHLAGEMPGYFANARVVVLGGGNHYRSTRVLSESTQNLALRRPGGGVRPLRHSHPVRGVRALRVRLGLASGEDSPPGGVGGHRPGPEDHRVPGPQALQDCDVVVATFAELAQFELDDLKGKTLISTSIDDERLNSLQERGIDLILDDVPQPFDGWWSMRRRLRR